MAADRPASATLREIAALWSEILAVPAIGPEASFIGLGGDSMAATQCINRIYRMFGCEISFGTFLEPGMTLRSLAALVDEAAAAAASGEGERVLG